MTRKKQLWMGFAILVLISYGKETPLDRGHDETALAKNRRDHFVAPRQ